jgi:anti-sigma factor RsiW
MTDHCQRTTLDVLLYRDGAISNEEQQAFERHLPACASCRARLQDATAMASLLRDVFEASPPVPPGFSDRVMREIERRERPAARPVDTTSWWRSLVENWRWFALGGLAVAAAAATVVLPTLTMGRGAPGSMDAQQRQLREENEAQVHRLSVDSEGTHPVVLQTAEGRTVIWMISDSQFGDDAGSEKP